MQNEEQMEDLKRQLATITAAINNSFPTLNLGKEPCVVKREEPAIVAVVKEPEPPKPATKPVSKQELRSALQTADEFLTEASVYRNWLLKSTMLDGLAITPSHVTLLETLVSCVRELRCLDKDFPRKTDSIEDITIFSE